ncbi:MAG: hypothetical protein PHR44_07645 [Candidatus Omnitrophica bacterium]|nr:hypothetical protein [Candidatus Omnitrophota bacterium]
MPKGRNITIAVKCAPERRILSAAQKAGIKAVELYLSSEILKGFNKIARLCGDFSFRYAIHAPSNEYDPRRLAGLAKEIGAGIVVFHNIYWEDEWQDIAAIFRAVKVRPCIENTYSVHEPLKFMRRYGCGRCLDLEHLEMECAGIYEEEFIKVIKQASHIHMTGYVGGSALWHTHIHQSPEHSRYLLGLLNRAGYRGMVVSEARASLQTYEEFKKLKDFCSGL